MARDVNRYTEIIQQAISTFFEEGIYQLIRQEAMRGTLQIDIDGKVKAAIEQLLTEQEMQPHGETAAKIVRLVLSSEVDWAAIVNLYLPDIQAKIDERRQAVEFPDDLLAEDPEA